MSMAWRLRTTSTLVGKALLPLTRSMETISHQYVCIHILVLLLLAGTPLLNPDMLFHKKAESQGDRHLHYMDNQRADKHQNHCEDLSHSTENISFPQTYPLYLSVTPQPVVFFR